MYKQGAIRQEVLEEGRLRQRPAKRRMKRRAGGQTGSRISSDSACASVRFLRRQGLVPADLRLGRPRPWTLSAGCVASGSRLSASPLHSLPASAF